MKRSIARSIFLASLKPPKARMFVVVGIVALLLFSSARVAQQASAVGLVAGAVGDLDSTFGIGGKVTTDFDLRFDSASAIVLQPDGKILAAGTASSTEDRDFALVRYNRDGTLDSDFGSGGKVTTDFSGGSDEVHGIAVQTDGRIVAGGFTNTSSGSNFALARYETTGALDSGFGSAGRVVTDFVGANDESWAIIIQPDGKILACGFAQFLFARSYDFALVRYNNDGSLDQSFGTDGKAFADFGGSEQGFTAALQLDGKIVLAGIVLPATTTLSDFGLVRFNANGTLDTGFGTGGLVATDFRLVNDGALAVAIQPGGKIVAAGSTHGAGDDFAIARYNDNGSLDLTFGSGGKVITDFSFGTDIAFAIANQPSGKIIVAGGKSIAFPGSGTDFALARYNEDGSLDSSFGLAGKLTTDFSGDGDIVLAVASQPDGRLIATGEGTNSNTSSDFALARYNLGGANFDICLQDDSNGNLLQFNSTTGDYQFADCRKGITLTGTGQIADKACKITLQDNGPKPKRPDRSVVVQVNRCTRAASASILIFSTGATFSITDSDIANSTCGCR